MSYHNLQPRESDTEVLSAFTPVGYIPPYPWYLNLTMVRMKGDVILTVRAPTELPPDKSMEGRLPGETVSIRFTREMWTQFVKEVETAKVKFEACDSLDVG